MKIQAQAPESLSPCRRSKGVEGGGSGGERPGGPQGYEKRKARLAEPGFSCEGVSRVASRSTFKFLPLLTLR